MIDRQTLREAGPPLQKEQWAGVVDCVGGQTLVTALSQTVYGGAAAACGLAGGNDLPGSVLPFILRGVTLYGIDSVMAPIEKRAEAWRRLAKELPLKSLERITTTHPMSSLPSLASAILDGKTRGRVVIDVQA